MARPAVAFLPEPVGDEAYSKRGPEWGLVDFDGRGADSGGGTGSSTSLGLAASTLCTSSGVSVTRWCEVWSYRIYRGRMKDWLLFDHHDDGGSAGGGTEEVSRFRGGSGRASSGMGSGERSGAGGQGSLWGWEAERRFENALRGGETARRDR